MTILLCISHWFYVVHLWWHNGDQCLIGVSVLREFKQTLSPDQGLGLEIDHVERIDSTGLEIDRLHRLAYHCSLRNFSWAACFLLSCLFARHNHVLCLWLLDNSQTCRLARSPDPCAKTTGRIEFQFGVLIGLGQCHFVLDGYPIPNRPSVTFFGEGYSWSLNILLSYISQTAQNRTLLRSRIWAWALQKCR